MHFQTAMSGNGFISISDIVDRLEDSQNDFYIVQATGANILPDQLADINDHEHIQQFSQINTEVIILFSHLDRHALDYALHGPPLRRWHFDHFTLSWFTANKGPGLSVHKHIDDMYAMSNDNDI